MTGISERVNAPVSTAELERRWSLVREVMDEQSLDALVVHNHVDGVGGNTRWFADLPAGGGYPVSLVFHRDAPMTLVTHGPFGGERALPREGDGLLRGIGKVLTTPSFASAPYCQGYDADLLAGELEGAGGRIGLVGPGQMPSTLVDGLRRSLPSAEFDDASEAIDAVKVIKSAEEQEAIRRTAKMQDEALAYAFAIVEPGMRESQVSAAVMHFAQERGSESGVYMAGSAPVGQPAIFQLRHNQERVIQDGDVFTFVVENNGAGGYYSHVGRVAVLGTPPRQLVEEIEVARQAQEMCVELLRPGTPAADVWEAYNEHLRSIGRPPEARLHCHGQGYDVVERPLVRSDETMTIESGMHIGCHPAWVHEGFFVYLCDNYLVGDAGVERIHESPQTVTEV